MKLIDGREVRRDQAPLESHCQRVAVLSTVAGDDRSGGRPVRLSGHTEECEDDCAGHPVPGRDSGPGFSNLSLGSAALWLIGRSTIALLRLGVRLGAKQSIQALICAGLLVLAVLGEA